MSQAIADFEQRRWLTSMDEFLAVLKADPRNPQAHAYINLIAHEMEHQKQVDVQSDRLILLAEASKELDNSRMDSRPLDRAILESTENDLHNRQLRAQEICQTARIQAQLGNLPAANDLVLQVLSEDANNTDAQRVLSDLQSALHGALESSSHRSPAEQATLEGFYAYGQADYTGAAAAWQIARQAVQATFPADDVPHQIALLHFEKYLAVAQTYVGHQQEVAHGQSLFAEGLGAFERQDFEVALDRFRQVALINPEYPQLAHYLIQSEGEVETRRTHHLSEKKRTDAARAFAQGVENFERGKLGDAQRSFEQVLALDPKHPQAHLYIQQIEKQKNPSRDPLGAQQHYEAGLIAYASGDLPQAIREWHIALRLDPENPKATAAVNKAENELVLSKDVP